MYAWACLILCWDLTALAVRRSMLNLDVSVICVHTCVHVYVRAQGQGRGYATGVCSEDLLLGLILSVICVHAQGQGRGASLGTESGGPGLQGHHVSP